MLVKRSSGSGKYQPKTKDDGTRSTDPAIDIVAPDSRKQAFAALFTDLYTVDKPIVANAEQATSLSSILDVAPQMADVRDVEIAATGSDTQSKELLVKLGNRATDLLSAAENPLSGEISSIEKTADKPLRKTSVRTGPSGNAPGAVNNNLTGLSPQNVEKLDNLVTQARQISSAAVSMQAIFTDTTGFKTVQTAADKDIEAGNKLLAKFKKREM